MESDLGATVTGGDFFDLALERGSLCRDILDRDFKQFTDLFAIKREIDSAVSNVRCRTSLSGNVIDLKLRRRLYSRRYQAVNVADANISGGFQSAF